MQFSSVFSAAAAVGLVLCSSAALAGPSDGQGFALGIHGGTTGLGVDAQLGLNPWLGLRASGDWLALSHSATYDNIPYSGHWRGVTGGLFADVHPFRNAFVISAGAYDGERRLRIVSAPTGPVSIGGHSFTPAQIGQLDGDIRLSSFEPFAGLGFNNTFRTHGHWSLIALAGVAFSGRPQVQLSSQGGQYSGLPIVQQSVANEQAVIAHDVRNYRYYPVATVGLGYRF